MKDLRILLFSFLIVPWIFSETAKKDGMAAQYNSVFMAADQEDLSSNSEHFDEDKKKKVLEVDYESPDDSDAPSQGEEATDDDELPTCLLCVCLTGSVYCEEVSPDMTAVPALPKETAYLYARFNKITKITNKDFTDIATLRRIDLTGNLISEIEDGAFSKLDHLEELSLAENKLVKLPMLPTKLSSFSASHNLLTTKGVKANAFKKLTKLTHLYLGDNALETIPQLPESLRIVHLQNNNITTVTDETFCKGNSTRYIRYNMQEIRLDGNPVILAQYPNSFICLRSLPIGLYK